MDFLNLIESHICHGRQNVRLVDGISLQCSLCQSKIIENIYTFTSSQEDPFVSSRLAEAFARWTGDENVPVSFILIDVEGILPSRISGQSLKVVRETVEALKALNYPFTNEGKNDVMMTPLMVNFNDRYVGAICDITAKFTADTSEKIIVNQLIETLNQLVESSDKFNVFDYYFKKLVPFVKSFDRTWIPLPPENYNENDTLVGQLMDQLKRSSIIRKRFSQYCLLFDVIHIILGCYVCNTDFQAVSNFVLDLMARVCRGQFFWKNYESHELVQTIQQVLKTSISYKQRPEFHYVIREIRQGNAVESLSNFLPQYILLKSFLYNKLPQFDSIVINELFPAILFEDYASQGAFSMALMHVSRNMNPKTGQVKKGTYQTARRMGRFIKTFIERVKEFDTIKIPWTLDVLKLFMVAKEILNSGIKDEDTEMTLAQDFVRNDKMIRLLKRMNRRNAEAVCAIDGLAGTISSMGPFFDFKRYLENLRYSLDGSVGNFDDDSNGVWKRSHIAAVRKLYKRLNDALPGDERLSPYVYQILRRVVLDVGGPELPDNSNEEMFLSEDFMKECIDLYKSEAPNMTLISLISSLTNNNFLNDTIERFLVVSTIMTFNFHSDERKNNGLQRRRRKNKCSYYFTTRSRQFKKWVNLYRKESKIKVPNDLCYKCPQNIYYWKTIPHAVEPTRETCSSFAWNLFTPDIKNVQWTLKPGELITVDTGIVFEVPVETSGLKTAVIIKDTFDLAFKAGVFVKPSFIDLDMKDSIKILLRNESLYPVQIYNNVKIAQILFIPAWKGQLESLRRNFLEKRLISNPYSELSRLQKVFDSCRKFEVTLVFGNLGRHPHLLNYYLDFCFAASETIGVLFKSYDTKECPYRVSEPVSSPLDFLFIIEPEFGYTVSKPTNVAHVVVLSSHLYLQSPGHREHVCLLHLGSNILREGSLSVDKKMWKPPIFCNGEETMINDSREQLPLGLVVLHFLRMRSVFTSINGKTDVEV
ncbi:Deoxyuridine 5'-triphosphate like protein [Argiope bruennichi]|uniref:Deoxyuridine 5'-triphosphate like protein n=1 Tax=Argiope bruennichi TaxID=94029 RepID=A0A8T0F0Q5_ARGBR|nr:Deoxyuridine 5'-triphosphate like protein [Argiope bruennichi]